MLWLITLPNWNFETYSETGVFTIGNEEIRVMYSLEARVEGEQFIGFGYVWASGQWMYIDMSSESSRPVEEAVVTIPDDVDYFCEPKDIARLFECEVK